MIQERKKVETLVTYLERQLEETLKRRLQDLPPYVDDFVYSLKNSKKIRTRLEYTKDISLFFDFLFQTNRISETDYRLVSTETINQLSTRDVQEFLDFLSYYEKSFQTASGHTLTQTYQNSLSGKGRKLASIRAWFNYLEKQKLITQNVVRDIEFEGQKHHLMKDILPQDELQRLLALFQQDTLDGRRNYTPELRKRDLMIILLLSYTGIRVGELVQLNRSDVQLQNQSMVIYRKGGKPQRLPLSSKLIHAFESYFEYRNRITPSNALDKDAVFLTRNGARMTDQSVRKLLQKYGELINCSIRLTPHVFRRTFGTEHYNRYGDMDLTATVLGHSSTETTRKHYARVNEDRIRQSLEDFDY